VQPIKAKTSMTNQWAGFCITVTALALCGVLRLTCEHSEGFVEADARCPLTLNTSAFNPLWR
jgi:RNA polymerase subunit RPABC4/transcription elongation factor Spt4